MGFLTWCFLEAHRGASMTSLWRHMPVIFGAWKLVDFTQDRDAQRHFKRLLQDVDVEKTGRASWVHPTADQGLSRRRGLV